MLQAASFCKPRRFALHMHPRLQLRLSVNRKTNTSTFTINSFVATITDVACLSTHFEALSVSVQDLPIFSSSDACTGAAIVITDFQRPSLLNLF
jgi:hypothetical protein